MKKNIGKTDRLLRTFMIAWFAFLILTGIAHYPQVYFLEVIMAILGLTVIFGYCPVMALFGINTLEKKPKDDLKSKI